MRTRALVASVIACLLAAMSVLVLPGRPASSWRESFSPQLVEPSGAHPVGVRRTLVETGTDDPWAPGDPRVVMVDIRYPAAADENPLRHYALARYMTEQSMLAWAPDEDRRLGLREGEVNWMFTTHSHEWAPVGEGRFPVVVLSAPERSMRMSLTSLAEELASHGSIVVTVDHPYDAPVVELWPTNEVVEADDAARELTGQATAAARAADVAAIIDRLGSLDEEIARTVAPGCVVVPSGGLRHKVAAATATAVIEAQIVDRYPRTARAVGALPTLASAQHELRTRSADLRAALAERLDQNPTCPDGSRV